MHAARWVGHADRWGMPQYVRLHVPRWGGLLVGVGCRQELVGGCSPLEGWPGDRMYGGAEHTCFCLPLSGESPAGSVDVLLLD
jgi:hypothetical protein